MQRTPKHQLDAASECLNGRWPAALRYAVQALLEEESCVGRLKAEQVRAVPQWHRAPLLRAANALPPACTRCCRASANPASSFSKSDASHPPTCPRFLVCLQELLSGTAKYLSAQAALQSAFKTTGGSSGSDPAPPAGGPD